MSIQEQPPATLGAAQAALAVLLRPFSPIAFVPDCEVVHPDEIASPSDTLLVHHSHMTIELQRHYHKRLEVVVREEHFDGDIYTRKIQLKLAGTDHIVECGIARLNFRFLTPEVRAEILAKEKPLGAILIYHRVHRRVKPRYFVRFPAGSRVMRLLSDEPTSEPVFGRLGTIYCDNEPAIELLEIVVNARDGQPPTLAFPQD